jgi:hypothetical protein
MEIHGVLVLLSQIHSECLVRVLVVSQVVQAETQADLEIENPPVATVVWVVFN